MFLYAISIRQHFFAYIFYFFILRSSIKNYRISFSSLSIFPVLQCFMPRARKKKKFLWPTQAYERKPATTANFFPSHCVVRASLILPDRILQKFSSKWMKNSFINREWRKSEFSYGNFCESAWKTKCGRCGWCVCESFSFATGKNGFPVSRADELFPHFQLHTSLWHSVACCCVYCDEKGRKGNMKIFIDFLSCYVRREVVHSASEDSLQMLTYSVSWWARHSSKDQRTKDSRTLPVLMLSWNLNLPLFAQTTVHVAAVISAWFMW